jgi:hypothetical protein
LKNFQLIAKGIGVAGALHDLAVQAHRWNHFTLRQTTPGSAHHDTKTIILRGPSRYTMDAVFNDIEAEWDYLNMVHLPRVRKLFDSLNFGEVEKLGRAMLVDLKAGGSIDAHQDEGAYAAYYDRFHLVLRSKRGNWFHCGDEALHMQEGELWKFNHHLTHSAVNRSDEGRIHLIIDARLKA